VDCEVTTLPKSVACVFDASTHVVPLKYCKRTFEAFIIELPKAAALDSVIVPSNVAHKPNKTISDLIENSWCKRK
jgi:hypothetical protein